MEIGTTMKTNILTVLLLIAISTTQLNLCLGFSVTRHAENGGRMKSMMLTENTPSGKAFPVSVSYASMNCNIRPKVVRKRGIQICASGQASQDQPEPPLNLKLIAQTVANQALIGLSIWTGGMGYQVLTEQAQFGPSALAMGIAGCIPLLAISRVIESSDSYIFSGLNLSTNMAVLRFFGSKPQPIPAFVLSSLMAGLTGVVEETIFRGQNIMFFADQFGGGNVLVGAFLSALLFAVLHTNPLKLFQGGEAALDNYVLLALQFVNAIIFTWLYLSTDNLAVPIVAHSLYDFYTFYKTHMVDVAGQMEYARNNAMMPSFSDRSQEQRWKVQRGEDFINGVKQSFYLMDTNRDGVLSKKELRIALFSYGVNLSDSQAEQVYRQADLDGGGDIDLDEFLQFVGPNGSTGKAVRNTLFGLT